jgi:hypothetical protein
MLAGLKTLKYPSMEIYLQLTRGQTIKNAGIDIIIRYEQSSKKKMGRNQMVQPAMQMHVLADNLCKRARECRDQKDYFNFPANEVNFVLNDHTINANMSKATTIAYHSISLRNYMKQKHNWTNHQIDKIWWKPLHRSTSKFTNNDLIKIQKFMYNYLPTTKGRMFITITIRNYVKYANYIQKMKTT